MRRVVAPGPGGPVETWVVSPADAGGEPLPTIVNLHGGPLGAWSPAPSIENVLLAAHGYRVVLPNIRGSAGYGRAWIRPQLGDWGGVDAADVLAAVDHVVGLGLADPDRLGILGLSYGGFLVNCRRAAPDRFRRRVLGKTGHQPVNLANSTRAPIDRGPLATRAPRGIAPSGAGPRAATSPRADPAPQCARARRHPVRAVNVHSSSPSPPGRESKTALPGVLAHRAAPGAPTARSNRITGQRRFDRVLRLTAPALPEPTPDEPRAGQRPSERLRGAVRSHPPPVEPRRLSPKTTEGRGNPRREPADGGPHQAPHPPPWQSVDVMLTSPSPHVAPAGGTGDDEPGKQRRRPGEGHPGPGRPG